MKNEVLISQMKTADHVLNEIFGSSAIIKKFKIVFLVLYVAM
jgi:hypothetical protein